MNPIARDFHRIGEAHRAETKGAWLEALVCARIVNTRLPERARGIQRKNMEDGAQMLVSQFGLSPDHYENRAVAWMLFYWLRLQGFSGVARLLRRNLYISTWEVVAQKWRQHNLDASDCLVALKSGAEEHVDETRENLDRKNGVDMLGKKLDGLARSASQRVSDIWAEVDRNRSLPSETYSLVKEIDGAAKVLTGLIGKYHELEAE